MLLDDPSRFKEINSLIRKKTALKKYYLEIYQKYLGSLNSSCLNGIAIELGSGGGFVKDVIPEILTTDLIPYPDLDHVINATKMTFSDESLRFIGMLNVLHHIPDAESFFREATRCLKPGGRIFIVDQYPGWISKPILKYIHHEKYDEFVPEWKFASSGPLSDANGALAWILFKRDREKFVSLFPELDIIQFKPHTPLRYWLTGGLKKWSLLPGWAFDPASLVDQALVSLSANLASFVDIELVKK